MRRLLTSRGLPWLLLMGVVATSLLLALQSGRATVRPASASTVSSAGYLGITFMDVSLRSAAYFNLPAAQGALITAVAPGSPAERTGLQPGDVIVSMDGLIVGDTCPLLQSLLYRRAGEEVVVVIQRGDQYLTLPVILSQRVP